MSIALKTLSIGKTFSLILERPHQPPPNTNLRPLPELPYSILTEYTLVSALQTGYDVDTQVWLSKANDAKSPFNIVFKFFIPSLMDPYVLYNPSAGIDRTAGDVAGCQRKAFDSLWDLQGAILPWFFGMHEVTIADELVPLLVMEYIPYSFDTIPRFFRACHEDIDKLIDWFKTAVKALETAHSRQIFHQDIRSSNLRHDTTQVVLIDWMNDIHHYKCFDPTDSCFPNKDIQDLLLAFSRSEDRIGYEFFLKAQKDAELGEQVRTIFGL